MLAGFRLSVVTPSDSGIKEAQCSKSINGTIRYVNNNGTLAVWVSYIWLLGVNTKRVALS